MRIYAFKGTRFVTDSANAGKLAAPPFDQIDPTLRDRLYGESPHQFARLTRPVAPDDGDIYLQASSVHSAWLSQGVIASDSEPSLYPYSIELPDKSFRLGLCTLVGVEDPSSGIIRPHEQTLDKPFADRLNLVRATGVDLEPVMFLSDDPGTLEELLRADMRSQAPLVEHLDLRGNTHRLYRVAGADRIAQYREVLGSCSAAIADGHHRYKVGRTHAEQTGAKPGTAAGAKMAVIFSLASENLVIDPIHRGFEKMLDLTPLRSLTASQQTLTASSGEEVARAVAAAPGPALAVALRGGETEIWNLDPARMPTGTPPGSDRLAVIHLHQVLLPAVGFEPANYLDGTVSYRSDPTVLWREVQAGELALGVFLPPMTAELFGQAISKGDLLPAKSTRFLPKLASGMVWSRHDTEVS
ncbi:MAG: DUF1015 domain-containing protein [Deltaproteobacteria bacterium]|nr:DUF1015 domain-containing protein [Deltaproteobacteria bacterium]